MTGALIFSVALVAAVLVSGLAHRSIVSTTVLFLAAGVVVGPVSGVVHVEPSDPLVEELTRIALFAVLFIDGSKVSLGRLRSAWTLPTRALAIGLPLTVLIGALASKVLLDTSWSEAALVAAVLAPTDPVFASSIIGREEVPEEVRHLLNIESGLNDGLVLPIVIVAIELNTDAPLRLGALLGEVATGVGVGVVVPIVVLLLSRRERIVVEGHYVPLQALAIGALVFTLAEVLHGNVYIAAFAAGITVCSVEGDIVDPFLETAEPISELVKLLAVFVFGLLLEAQLFTDMTAGAWLLVIVILFAIRPLALGVALIGSRTGRAEFAAAAWFGPKGFASVVYGLLVFGSAVDHAALDFGVIAATIAASMVLHSSTDVPIAQWFARRSGASDDATDDGGLRIAREG